MNVSLNWLKDYMTIDQPIDEVADIFTAIGLEVSGVEKIETIKGGLRDVVAGEVLTCSGHPNADRLSLCTVDIGTGEPLQIVCGAPNVAVGQKVWVAQIGATLYPHGGDESFTIKKAKIRGKQSVGMICAEDELGLGTDHEGIIVLPADTAIGTLASEYYKVKEDHIINIDLTPNRSDAIAHLGVAEDLAAYLQVNANGSGEVSWPSKAQTFPGNLGTPITVEVLNEEACPRYTGLLLENVTIKESPQWLKERLLAVGVRPINNSVDITNFVLHEMGQPLHAFDADKIGGKGIVVKTLETGSLFVTLDGVQRKLDQADLMICDAEGEVHCIGGVFGGLASGVTEKTTRIFLEAAHFDAVWIRRTSTRHQLRTDAARSFEKGTDPNVCVTALKRAASLMVELAGASIASDIVDVYPKPIEKTRVYVRWGRIDQLIGVKLTRERIKNILAALSIDITTETEDGVVVAIPTNKPDVNREADVIEEILRIHGFNQIPLQPRMEMALVAVDHPTRYAFRNRISAQLTAQGFCEMMGMSLTETAYLEEGGLQVVEENRVTINNTSNVGLNVLRPGLMVSALETIRYNLNRNQDDLKFFEFGRGYWRQEGETHEKEQLSLLIVGNDRPRNWLEPDGSVADFYTIKKYVDSIIHGIFSESLEQAETDAIRYCLGLVYHLGGEKLVEFGRITPDLTSQFDINKNVYYAEFHMETLYSAARNINIEIEEVSKFPGVKRDLAFILGDSVDYASLKTCVTKSGGALLKQLDLFDVYQNPEHLGPNKKSYAVQLHFQDDHKTLTDMIVEKQVNNIVNQVQSELGGELRK